MVKLRGKRWHYDFTLGRKRFRGSIPEASTQSQARIAEAKILLETRAANKPDAPTGVQRTTRRKHVYLVEMLGCYKIGIAANITTRMRALTMVPTDVTLIHSFLATDGREIERRLHVKYECFRVKGEWFNLPLEAVEWLRTLNNGALDQEGSDSPVWHKEAPAESGVLS